MVIDEQAREEAIDVLEPRLQQELLQYEGRWVAITRSDLIAVGDSADEVIRRSADKGVADPIVHFVPRDGDVGMYL